jgi:ketosteroid isomerase-like protein
MPNIVRALPRPRWLWICAAFALCFLWIACKPAARTAKTDSETIQIIVRAILDQQVKDWNDGKIDRFMRGYAQAQSTRFASGGDISQGWQTVLERYRQKYPDRAAMGKLTFSSVDITVLSPDAALAFGRWRLQRATNQPSGLFTLLFRNTKDGWRIVHDHTSAAAN